jgi:hypothetical protein
VKATVCMHFNPLCSVLAYQKPGWCLLLAPTTLFTWDKKALMPFRIRVEPWRASGSLSCTDLRPFSSYTIIKKLICSTCSADITFTGSCCQFVWPINLLLQYYTVFPAWQATRIQYICNITEKSKAKQTTE